MRKVILLGIVALILVAGSTAGCTSNVQTGMTQPTSVAVGALLPMTGEHADVGANLNSTIHVAEADVNDYLAATNASIRVHLVVKDTGPTTEGALAAIQALHAEGVVAVIGPYTSPQVKAVAPYADQNGMVLVSYSSTAPSLGVERTNLFRLVPDDSRQGPALAAAMSAQGVKLLIPFVRDDDYSNGLINGTRTSFEQLGGVVAEGARFAVNTTNFIAALDIVRPQLTQSIGAYGGESVGVLFIGYESDTVPMLIAAGNDPRWSTTRWWGVEALQIDAVLANDTAAQAAARLNFTAIQQVEGQGERYEHLMQNASVKNTVQTAYGPFAYDAVWIMARAVTEVGTQNSTALRDAVPRIASSYNGITGNTTLNAVGDRAYANYDLWTIRSQNLTYVKVKTAQFRTDPLSGIAVVEGAGTTTAVVH
ncbi:MAG: ABC transporter substrate-binding protein [Halobacteriota archaeon]